MTSDQLFLLGADLILFGHILFVAFVVVGLVLIFTGAYCNWAWVRNPWFRIAHIAAIGVVAAQSWIGAICPLTSWEMMLRERAGDAAYSGAFVAHWLESLLYYEAPAWAFTLCYSVFAAIVIASWFVVRPRPLQKGATSRNHTA
jgi:hypothetical protein